ncbi:MAG: AAA family ATPase, partial [Treponema sp.]|nr:AAA family ATPase [Treponema sp.]
RLSDPNHVLESGIEIFAQPPGKKLENITLLSGGEKSMTAVALLFATYMVKPSPFCLLDEIDAALDEQNVIRFVQLLREFGSTSQFIVITHNKRTVTGAGTLLGVTMEESGVTKVISVRLENEKDGPHESIPDPEPFVEEEVEHETGMELPLGIDDPSLVSEAELRPIRSALASTGSAIAPVPSVLRHIENPQCKEPHEPKHEAQEIKHETDDASEEFVEQEEGFGFDEPAETASDTEE